MMRANKNEPPTITCRCHAARCPVCFKCSKCGCNHDGEEVAVKRARPRGQHKLQKAVTRNMPRRAKTTSDPLLIDSPLVPQKQKIQEVGEVARNLLLQLNAKAEDKVGGSVVPSACGVFKRPSDVLLAFGLGHKIDILDSHLPAIVARRDPRTWSNPTDPSIKKVIGVIRAVFEQVIAVFCDATEDAIRTIRGRVLRGETDDGNNDDATAVFLHVARFLVSAARGSVEKRVVRSFLCSSLSYTKICGLQEQVPGFKPSRTSFTKGNADNRHLTGAGRLQIDKRTVRRYDERVVEDAIRFILSPENVSFFSWGTKRLKLDGQQYHFPAIIRKHTKKRMHELYTASTAAEKLSSSSIYQLVSTLTAGCARARRAIDYVAGFLVYDPFEVIHRMIQSLTTDKRNDLKFRAEKAQLYLKYGFDFHIRDPECTCLLTNRHYALQRSSPGCSLDVCSMCKEPFEFFENLKAVMKSCNAHASAFDVLDDCVERARLFLGHRVRVVNQQLAMQRKVDDMKARCLERRSSDEAVVLLDFKMKFDPVYYREKLVDHNRDKLKQVVGGARILEKAVKAFIGRANDVQIEILPSRTRTAATSIYSDCPEFMLHVFDYSAIGSGRRLRCNPFNGEAVLMSGLVEPAQEEDDGDDMDGEAERRSADADENDEAADDEEDDVAGETEAIYIDPNTSEGLITGVQIVTQGQLCRRTRNWRSPALMKIAAAKPVSPPTKSQSMTTFAVRRALHLHAHGALGISDPRLVPVYSGSTLSVWSRPISFDCGWARRQPKGKMYGKRYAALETFSDSALSDQQIKSKMSNMKTQVKRQRTTLQ